MASINKKREEREGYRKEKIINNSNWSILTVLFMEMEETLENICMPEMWQTRWTQSFTRGKWASHITLDQPLRSPIWTLPND